MPTSASMGTWLARRMATATRMDTIRMGTIMGTTDTRIR